MCDGNPPAGPPGTTQQPGSQGSKEDTLHRLATRPCARVISRWSESGPLLTRGSIEKKLLTLCRSSRARSASRILPNVGLLRLTEIGCGGHPFGRTARVREGEACGPPRDPFPARIPSPAWMYIHVIARVCTRYVCSDRTDDTTRHAPHTRAAQHDLLWKGSS